MTECLMPNSTCQVCGRVIMPYLFICSVCGAVNGITSETPLTTLEGVWAKISGYEFLDWPALPRWQKPTASGPVGLYCFPTEYAMLKDIEAHNNNLQTAKGLTTR